MRQVWGERNLGVTCEMRQVRQVSGETGGEIGEAGFRRDR